MSGGERVANIKPAANVVPQPRAITELKLPLQEQRERLIKKGEDDKKRQIDEILAKSGQVAIGSSSSAASIADDEAKYLPSLHLRRLVWDSWLGSLGHKPFAGHGPFELPLDEQAAVRYCLHKTRRRESVVPSSSSEDPWQPEPDHDNPARLN